MEEKYTKHKIYSIRAVKLDPGRPKSTRKRKKNFRNFVFSRADSSRRRAEASLGSPSW